LGEYWFLRYGVHKVFRMHRLTDRRTDTPENTPALKVFDDGGIKAKHVYVGKLRNNTTKCQFLTTVYCKSTMKLISLVVAGA